MSAHRRKPATQSSVPLLDPLPKPYYLIFGLLEPLSILAGCVYAYAFTEKYHRELVPEAFLPVTPSGGADGGGVVHAVKAAAGQGRGGEAVALHPAVRMAIEQLGSCYFLLALNSFFVFRFIRNRLSHEPTLQETFIKTFLFALGVADWSHILSTIHALPQPRLHPHRTARLDTLKLLLTDPSSWNSLLFGNILITLLLFSVRCAWWLGLGRGTVKREQGSKVAGKGE